MGNQEMKSAMSKIQDRSFNANQLDEFEAKLWREQSRDALSGFESHMNLDGKSWENLQPFQSKLNIEKSGIDEDEKRYQDQAMDCWQTGFSNTQKKIETLKHGDFKQVVIPSNYSACEFESSMQVKTAILTGLFFVRHQGGSEAMDDFFTFARKYIEKQESTYVYEGELGSTLLANPKTLQSLLSANPTIINDTVQRLLDASEKISPSKLFKNDQGGFQDDLKYMQLRRILISFIEQAEEKPREMTIKLLLRWGLIRASAEDLLLAAQLQQKYNVDVSNELEFICKQSEVYKKPLSDSEGNSFERTEHKHIQSRMSHERGGDRAYENDQCVTDGTKWFVFSDQRGFTRGKKTPQTGEWNAEFQTDDKNWSEMTMLCHDGCLYVRHKEAKDVVFQQFDKTTLKPIPDQTPFTVPEGEEDYLKWTPLDTVYEENSEEGNRWHRASPMFSDGECIYMLVQYRLKGHDTRIIKTVLEVYEIEVEDRTMKRINEQTLYKNDQGALYSGSKKNIDKGGHLARGTIACNQEVLLWWTAHNFHVYEYATGIRKRKEHVNSTSYITVYDDKEQWYYYMDAACYSWLKRCKIVGFKPRVLEKVVKDLPDLPIVFDTYKSEILDQIKEEEKKDVPAPEEGKEEAEEEKKEEAKHKKKDPRTDLFDLLSKQDDDMLDNFQPKAEERKRKTEPIANINEICQAIILSKMSTDAQQIQHKVNQLGDKQLLGEEMLPYYKSPYAINCSKSYMIRLRQALCEHITKLNEGKITTMKQSNVLNLLHIYSANIAALSACRIEMGHILPDSELKLIVAFQNGKLDSLKLFEGQLDKANEDLSPEEILQLYIVEASSKLNQKLESNLDVETRAEKLQSVVDNLSKAMEDDESAEAKVIKRSIPLMSTKKIMKDIFEGTDEELATARKIITICVDYLKGKVSSTVSESLQNKVFQHRELGINKVIRTFAKTFCQELMVAFGNQLLTIMEKQGAKSEGELSAEEQANLKDLNDAKDRKKVLEPMLYETFIQISQIFKSQVQDITQQIKDAEVHNWEDQDKAKNFFEFVHKIFNAEKSIPRICLMFSLMMSSHVPDVIWLDEISEALKNCAVGLNFYINMKSNLSYKAQLKLQKIDKFHKQIEENLRAINYSIGVISYRLMHLKKDESEDKKQLNKMNILQGGIEARFIPSLSQETKTQIEGSFKITNDKQLQSLALQNEDQVISEAQDSLFSGIIHSEKSQAKIEMTMKVLQQGLVSKEPMIARIGGDWGLKLTRACFAVMLKFSDNIEEFMKLTESVDFTANDIGEQEQGDQKIKSIEKQLKTTTNDQFVTMLKTYVQSSQMRKWTQKVKLNISEKIEKEEEEKLRKEITEANPSKEAFTDPLNEEQSTLKRERSDQRFDEELPKKYQEVIKKAEFLLKLTIPQAFKDAKKEELMKQVSQGLVGQFQSQLGLFKSRSTVTSIPGDLSQNSSPGKQGLQRSLTSGGRRNSTNSADGMKKITTKGKLVRKQTLLVKDSNIAKKDTEVDWRNRMKQWKQRQQTDGAVTGFDDQMKQQSQSVSFSVLGCLQASFSCDQLQERVEQSLVNGLRRSAGLHLLNFAMNLNFDSVRFCDLIQWFQGAIRDNRIQTTHYLAGFEGCGIKAENGIRHQFFQIINRVNHALKYENELSSTEYVHLLNALCWNFNREDHQFLVNIEVFRTLQCGDGTLMHPIFRTWGQEDTNFQMQLHKEGNYCLASRLRQVFEFLVQTVLEGLFVKKEAEKLDLGGEDAQEKMVSKVESFNQKASESLLNSICDIMFAHTNRYLRMKNMFSEDDMPEHPDERFVKSIEENDDNFKIENRCPRDLANYINRNGGHRTFTAKQKLTHYLNNMKAQMINQKIVEAGDVQNDSTIAVLIRDIMKQSKMGAVSLADSINFIVNRDYRVLAVIKNSSWDYLTLEEPVLNMEEKSQVTGISVEEYKQIAEAAMKLKQDEEERQRLAEEEANKPDEQQPQIEEEKEVDQVQIETGPSFVAGWYCGACTFRNSASNTVCEVCQSPKEAPIVAQDQKMAPPQWSCSACTMLNAYDLTVCSICGTAKSVPEAVPEVVPEAVVESAAAAQAEEAKAPEQEQSAFAEEAKAAEPEEAKAAETEETKAAEPEEAKAAENEEAKAAEAVVEEVKEPTEEERQAEEEKQIQAESDPKTRYNRYLTFLQTIQPSQKDEDVKIDENKIKGTMYTETSLFRIIRSLDQLITLSEESSEGYQIVQRFSNPENLKHIIEMSVETSINNQILVQKILQQIIRLDLPKDILDESVRLAQQPINLSDKPNLVYKILLKEGALDFSESLFLKFLFNRLENSRRALYKQSQAEQQGLNSVIQESMRTIRCLYTEVDKNSELRKIVNEAFTSGLIAIDDLTEAQIDSVMSLIPEAAFQRIAIGQPCINKDGKIFSVVGVLQSENENSEYHHIPLYPNFSTQKQALSLAGLYFDPENPERQDLFKERMIYSQPLLDLDEEQTVQAARLSVFMDASALEQLIEIAVQDDSALKDEKAKNALGLLQTFIVRGLYNMTRILKSEYIEFLSQFDLLTNFLKFLLGVSNQLSASPEEVLVSSLQLELKADYLREAVMSNNKMSFGASEKFGGGNIISSDNGAQFILMHGQTHDEMFYFQTKIQFGENEGKFFEGPLLQKNESGSSNGIFVLPSQRLKDLSKGTLEILKQASIVITDDGLVIDEFMSKLKVEILKDIGNLKPCSQTCFKVLEHADDIPKIMSIIEAGSTVKNTDMTNRAYFLGMILKHIGQEVWDKVDKSTYIKKYMNIGAEHSFEAVSTTWSTQILAELIEAKWPEEESFMVQISVGEVFEKIRSGEFAILESSATVEEVKLEASEDQVSKDQQPSQAENSQEAVVEEESKIPNFVDILTQTEKLSNDVAESFYNASAPSKPTTDTYSEQFKSTVFGNSSMVEPAEVAKNYQTTVKTLKQTYGRQILLNILSNASENLDEHSTAFISSKSSFQKLCDLVHNDFMTASHVNEFSGNPQLLESSKVQINSLLKFMKEIPEFTSYFVKDFLKRASSTLEKCAIDDFSKLGEFSLKTLRKAMDGSPMLDPLNLLFFQDQIFELGYIQDEKLPEMLKATFDLLMGYSLVFKQNVDFYINLNLLKMAKKVLAQINDNLALFLEKEELITDLFSNKFMQCFAISLDCDSSDSLKDRQKMALELIVSFVKTQERFRDEFNKNIPLGFEQSQSVKKALNIFQTIEEGQEFKKFLAKQKFKAILQSTDAKKIQHLARNYCTDDKKFESKFYKEVFATDKDLVIKVDGHSSHDLLEIKKYGIPEKEVRKCQNGHKLLIQIGNPYQESHNGTFGQCDICRTSFNAERVADPGFLRCAECNYDACRDCRKLEQDEPDQNVICTQTILADGGSLQSGRTLVMNLPKGSRAVIQFPVRPQIVNHTGKLYCRNQDYEFKNDTWSTLSETAQCAAIKVISMHHSAIFIGGDESIWGMGYRAQGQGQENCKLRKLPSPESMRNIKAVAHGKFFRLVLTEEGRIYWNGQSRKYMFGMGGSGTARLEGFHEMENNYFRIEDGDKLMDVAGGRNQAIVATERGKIYATSYMFYRHFNDCRHNSENNEDYPFELRMPEGFKAKKIYSSEKHYNIWVTGEDNDGSKQTFGAGQSCDQIGHGEGGNCSAFKPLKVPAGTYMQSVTNQGHIVHGLDQDNNLWVWGGDIYGCDVEEDRNTIYSNYSEREHKSVPMKVKWFADNTLKVLECKGGYNRAIVKCQTREGKVVFYAMACSEDDLEFLGGSTVGLTSCYKHLISRLEVDGDRVEDFAIGRESVYLLMAADKQESKSIDPENPQAKELIHFYQKVNDAGVKEWQFVTKDQYEAKKDTLPDVCFATRHPIQKLLVRVVKQRAGHATEDDINNTNLADLNSLIPELQLNDGASEHTQKTTNGESSIAKDSPLYYSYSTVSGQESKIFATESEALGGDQAWDMNPVIYYRVKKPADALDKLPKINLAEHFSQAEENESVSFTIMNEKIDADEIAAIEITDQVALNRFKAFNEFTNDQDTEILKIIDQQIGSKKTKVEDCKAGMFVYAKADQKTQGRLDEIEEKVIQMRMTALFKFSKAFSRCVKYISVDERFVKGSISHKHFSCKNLAVSTVINQIVDSQLAELPNGDAPETKVNRRKAFEFEEEGNVDHEGKYSIFGQVCSQLRTMCPDMSNFRSKEVDGRCYRIKFLGEGSIDAGGPFRDSLVNIVQEMESGLVPLLIKSPNNRNDHGVNRDCFILNPTSNSPAHLDMYKYMGGYIAFGILSKSPVPFTLAPTVWKQILGERMSLSDLESIDAYSSQVLTDLQNHGASLSDADFEAGVDQNFTTVLSNGDEIELCEGGQDRQVTKATIDEFINLVLKARFNESTQQIKAIQDGLDTVFKGNLGLISYLTSEAIEIRACGAKEIDMERLKSITIYPNCGSDHEIVPRFWRVFESFTHEERSEYLKFVWGRNRLPVDLTNLSRKHELRLTTGLDESGFPQAHTCFFQLDIPYYRNDEICRKRLLQASQMCGTVDTDNNNFAEE